MKVLVITIVSILIAFAASVANIQWLAVIAVLGAIAGASWQYKDGQPFELRFEQSAWQKSGFDVRALRSEATPRKNQTDNNDL